MKLFYLAILYPSNASKMGDNQTHADTILLIQNNQCLLTLGSHLWDNLNTGKIQQEII